MSRVDNKVLLVVTVGLLTLAQVGLAGAAHFVHRQTSERIDIETNRVASERRDLERAEAVVEPVVVSPSPRWRLLDDPDVAGTMQVLQAVGDASRVVFDRVKATQSSTAGKQSFQIAGRGPAANVCEFLAAVEQNERLIVIESGRTVPGGDNLVAFELGLATYHVGGAR